MNKQRGYQMNQEEYKAIENKIHASKEKLEKLGLSASVADIVRATLRKDFLDDLSALDRLKGLGGVSDVVGPRGKRGKK